MRTSRTGERSECHVKAAVRERDGYRCTKCGMTNEVHKFLYGKKVEVHRLSPGGKYIEDRCITICRDCHRLEPKSSKSKERATIVLPPRYAKAVREEAKKNMRALSTTVLIALEEYFLLRGVDLRPSTAKRLERMASTA